MNSERIRRQFGSFGIDVLESSAARRVSSLYSLEQGDRICRTYAVVEFNSDAVAALAEEHALVTAGHSIGAVFKAGGWAVDKRHTRIGSVTLTSDHNTITALMRLEPPQQVAVQSYVFAASRGGPAFEYAAITELHHPRYLTEADVQAICGEPEPFLYPGQATGG